jgi:glycosyltransferase involved in cell wall biosynthesis/GT2 family glycosyltransferase
MAQITVAMPARNAAAFIAEAIASVQQQTEIDWELIVVDDASEDGTANVVRHFDDARIRLLTNNTRRGIGYGHNRVIAASAAPYIAHVDADDFILPGALSKMVQALRDDPQAGQAHCQFYDIDQHGRVSRERFLERMAKYERRGRRKPDYRRELVTVGNIASGLRTYRRAVLERVGGFNEGLPFGEDLEMALRITDQSEIVFVPEYLYARRLHSGNTTETLSFRRFRFFWQRCHTCRALKRSRQVTYFCRPPYKLHWLLLVALANTLRVTRAAVIARDIIWPRRRTWRTNLRQRFMSPALRSLYEWTVTHGEWWRLTARRSQPKGDGTKKIGYYLWRFPILTETFIRREVQALREHGLAVEVFADEPGDLDDPALVESTCYLPRDLQRLRRAKRFFFRRHPARYWRAFVYVVLHRYAHYKTWQQDVAVFERALELAYLLREHQISHLHAPWAERTAFIALVGAALLDIPYSVEARAHDLHRRRFQYALREKFQQAAFVITNSDYNARAIESYLTSPHPPVHVLPNLFPLRQFRPRAHKQASEPFRILCVARLVEEKGLIYLLRACARLREDGLLFHCDIIGGSEQPPSTVYWIHLKRLQKKLQLEECVRFRGAQSFETILEAYGSADLFVLPCVIAENGGRDISPNALIEAMAMGLPVVSTHISTIPEVVEDGVSGILVPPNDATQLANTIGALMQDPARRSGLGAAARQRVEQNYDAERNVLQFARLFQPGGVRTRPRVSRRL